MTRSWEHLIPAGAFFAAALTSPSVALSQKIIDVHNELPKGGNKKLFDTKMRLEKNLEIGKEKDEGAPVFARISDVAVDAQGRVYLVETAQNMVFVYDDHGSFVTQIGREGEGPGEFRSPEAVALNSRGEVFVADRQRVTIFDSKFAYVASFNHRMGDATIRGMVVNETGGVFLSSFEIFDQQVIHKFSRDGTKLISFCDSYAAGTGEDFRAEQVYAGGPIDIDSQGRICYSQLTPYEIRKFSDFGSTLMVVDRENGFMTIPEVRKDGNKMQFTMPTGSYGFCVLSDGTMVNCILATKEQENAGLPGSFVDVFSADGKLLGSIAIQPSSLLLGRDDTNQLYFLQYSQPVTIVRYALKK